MSGASKLPQQRPGPLALAALLLGLCALHHLSAPAVVNGDGVGYLKRIATDGLAPGHIAFLPLARQIAAFVPHQTPAQLIEPLRWLSLLCVAATLALFFRAARLFHPAPTALLATALLGLFHAIARSAQEVEVYGPAGLFAMVALFALVRQHKGSRRRDLWALVAGCAIGLGALLHLTLVLLAPGCLALTWRWRAGAGRWRGPLFAALGLALVGGLPLLWALTHQGIGDLAGALRWLRSADHGVPYPLSLTTPLVAGWGIARSLVFVPYPYEASLVVVAGLTLVATGAWVALLHLRVRPDADGAPLGARFLALWLGPLALFGLLFYPSDTERWVFALPALLLVIPPRPSRAAIGLLLLVGGVNLASALPRTVDHEPWRRARATERLLAPSDLLITPGHGWPELVGLHSARPSRRFTLIHHVGAARDLHQALRLMRQRMLETTRRGGRVFVARLHDERDRRGFKELARLGLTRAGYAALFQRHRPRPTAVAELWQLSP